MLLWPAASTNKKGSKLDIGNLATRGKIRLMPDEHPVGITIDGEQPSITVGAVVNLSSSNGHTTLFPPSIATVPPRDPNGDDDEEEEDEERNDQPPVVREPEPDE